MSETAGHRSMLCALVLLAVSSAGGGAMRAGAPANPVTLTRADASALTETIVAERAETETWLRSDPTSYLATVARRNYDDKATLTIGRATDNDVRIDADGVLPHHLRVTVQGDRFAVTGVDRPATFFVKDVEQHDAVLDPAYIKVGRFLLRLSHQRFPAIIVFDPQSPRFKTYKGLQYFPVNLAYRFELPLTRNPRPEEIIILSTQGNSRRAVRVGWFDFVVDGRAQRLEASRLLEPGVGENDFSVFFRDATSGRDSYALGRYVDPVRTERGTYVLDFNAAYNPACAFSDHYNCPIPPRGNTLDVAIRAGEKDSRYH